MFGIEFGPLVQRRQLPSGELLGRIHIGDWWETFAADTCVWSAQDYLRHWSLTARRLLVTRQSALFCTNWGVRRRWVELWPAKWRGRVVEVRNEWARPDCYSARGLEIRPSTAQLDLENPEASVWIVTEADLRRLAVAVR